MSTVTPLQTDEQRDRLAAVVEDALTAARRQGATAAEAGVSTSQGLSLSVRLGEVETVEHNRDKTLSISVYFGHKQGSASTSDLTPAAVNETVRAACTIARYTAEDEYAGLADAGRMASDIPDLDLYHPWSVDMDQAIELARRCEGVAREADPRITNSEGATVSSHEGVEVYGNSHGFLGAVASSRHSLSCSVIGQDASGMQRDYWYTVARDAAELEAPEAVGRRAAERTLRRLGGRKLSTRRAPVLYEASVARSLLGHFVGAVRGSALYRKASFLVDALGTPVFNEAVNLYERPHLKRALGSAPFDSEGVATADRDLVRGGVLEGYVLDAYSARKLGMQTTGNAGGVHNLCIDHGPNDLDGLLRQMGEGLLLTELIGFGVNNLTGDYSRGAAGFWVQNGEIQYPVEEITVAGNLKDMFRNIAAVGSDVDLRGNIRTGSILIPDMAIAGA
jgi:PmbA protein